MKAFLRSSEGILALRPKITTIGRHDDSDVVLKSAGLEDHHAAIEFSDAEHSFILRDFNTGSGTFVNDCHIQNVAVKVGPGDVLRFGSSGPAFELVQDNLLQVPCPLVNRRIAWPGQIQVVTETGSPPAAGAASQFPLLPSPQSPPTNPGWPYATSGMSPHRPLKKRPGSAWGRTITSSAFSPDASGRPPGTLTGNGALPGPLAISLPGDALLKEKEETILKLGDEINRLSAFESECGRKDALITELRREISGMTEKVTATLAKKEAAFQQELASLDKDADAKAEEIRSLKEQVTSLQKNTSEVLYHSLSERDLQIAHWKQEHEVLKKSSSLTSGLVTSLQKDVVTKEQRIQQLRMDMDKLRQESQEKDDQLAYISAQCSRIKAEAKRELRERDISACQTRITELELQASQSKEEIKRRCAEQETLTGRLAEATKAQGELRKEAERRSQQVQELGRRERLLRSEMEQTAAQAQRFRNQVSKALFPELPEEPLADQQIVEEIDRLQAAKEESDQKEEALRKEGQIQALEMEKLSSDLALLKKSLDGAQGVLKGSYCSHHLKEEIGRLQRLAPSAPQASEIQASLTRILHHVLSWVEAMESLLRDVGADTSAGETGSYRHLSGRAVAALPMNWAAWPGRLRSRLWKASRGPRGQRPPGLGREESPGGWHRAKRQPAVAELGIQAAAGRLPRTPEGVGSAFGRVLAGVVRLPEFLAVAVLGPEFWELRSAQPQRFQSQGDCSRERAAFAGPPGCQASPLLPSSLPGMAAYVKRLLDQHRSVTGQVQALQNQLRVAEESRHSTLQEKQQLEEEIQAKERKIHEEGKQQKEVLAMMAALEEAKLRGALEEERKRVQELEAQVKELSEVIEQGANLEGALHAELNRSLEALKAAKSRTAVAEEKLAVLEGQLRSLGREAEALKQKHREEVSEYQEQVKQHARTIVDLEERLTAAAAQQGKGDGVSEQLGQCPFPDWQEIMLSSWDGDISMNQTLSLKLDSAVLLKSFFVPIHFREELVAAKQEIQANQAVISELKKELSKARATMSDVIGELSEKQKAELEEKRSLAQSQARELGHLQEKLSETSTLLGQKETSLQAATEELRKAREKMKELLREAEEKASELAAVVQHKGVQTRAPPQDDAPPAAKAARLPEEDPSVLPGSRAAVRAERLASLRLQDPPLLCLADLGARCKGSRHDETIRRQKETLAELRKRIRKLEKGLPPDSDAKNSEPLLVLRKLPAERGELTREKDQAVAPMVARDAREPPRGVSVLEPNVTVERTAKLEMADALDLSENLYFGFVRGLSSLMGLEELMGSRTLKHLPQAEREKVSLLRQKDLELLLDRIGKLKSRLERKESLLKEYEGDIGHFRSNRQALQACQSRMARLADQVYREVEEKALLKEALERMRLQLNQEKRLNQALKKPKVWPRLLLAQKPPPDSQARSAQPPGHISARHSSGHPQCLRLGTHSTQSPAREPTRRPTATASQGAQLAEPATPSPSCGPS
ncbi:forkhead-associated domain-containing protein 1 [Candoia aspera]|uniref:forkhead-associated domain-containing protein 1 n=1 Tax=Candoia aspera TaxID=51853 RepID=UPI002FD832EA